MKPHLKPLNEQVIVITGASSGIGLATAQAAARQGAKLVLAARSEHTLLDIVDRIQEAGGEAVAVGCDVGNREDVERVAQTAMQRFGRVDTWINDAGISIYGRLDEVNAEDSRRLFETNFWGVVNGSLTALPLLRERGGALINIGSEVSDAVVPLQGMYSASKHAVKGFTDALRVEIEEVDKAPVSITLIQPTAVDTPYPQHARNYMEEEPRLPDPLIDPKEVVDAILEASTHHVRDKTVGTMAKVNTLGAKLTGNTADKQSAKRVKEQHYAEGPRDPEGALYHPSEATLAAAGHVHGSGGRKPRK